MLREETRRGEASPVIEQFGVGSVSFCMTMTFDSA